MQSLRVDFTRTECSTDLQDSLIGAIGEEARNNMTIHKCDMCGKEMSVWFKVLIRIDANDDLINVGQYLHLCGEKEICTECAKKAANLCLNIKGSVCE